MDWQHANLKHKLHIMHVEQLQHTLSDASTASTTRLHTRNILAARRDKYANDALRAIAMQRRQFAYYSLEDPSDAAKTMPSIWFKPPSAAAAGTLVDMEGAALDTSALLSSAVGNYVHILKNQAATPTFQAPQSCLVSYKVNSSSHPSEMQNLMENGSLSLFFSPPTALNDSDAIPPESDAASQPLPIGNFAYDASVTEVHIFVDMKESEVDNVGSDVENTAKEARVMRIQILKSGTDLRLDEIYQTRQYPSRPTAFEYLYASDSECPISSSQSSLSGDQSTFMSSSGTSPSLYGLWTFVPVLSKRELQRISDVRVLMRVEHKVGVLENRKGKSSVGILGGSQLLRGGAEGDLVNGVCGAVPDKCAFAMTQGSSAEGCHSGYIVQRKKREHVAVNSIWLGVVIGFSVALVSTLVLVAWTGWRIVVHQREVERQLLYFKSSERGSTMSEENKQSGASV